MYESDMAYEYALEREAIFTEAAQIIFLEIRDRVDSLLKEAGAVRMSEAIAGSYGDNWTRMACVDRLVELGELREISRYGFSVQSRVFIRRIPA